MTIEVVLRDFDGSRTIYPAELPLQDLIQAAETEDLGTVVGKVYAKTERARGYSRWSICRTPTSLRPRTEAACNKAEGDLHSSEGLVPPPHFNPRG